jgi:eukaryotic-like serine/threonine-protein kinase
MSLDPTRTDLPTHDDFEIDVRQRVLRERNEMLRRRMYIAAGVGAIILLLYIPLDISMAGGRLQSWEILSFVVGRVVAAAWFLALCGLLYFRVIGMGLRVFDVSTFLLVGLLCTWIIARMWHIVPDYYVGLGQIMMARCVLVPGGAKSAAAICITMMVALPIGLALCTGDGMAVFADESGARVVAAMSGLGGFLAIGLLGAASFERLLGRAVKHEQLRRYSFHGKLGQGGVGTVYRATDHTLDRPCAVKVIPAERVEDAEARQRFDLEARRTSQLESGHVINIYDYGSSESGGLYYVMEHLEGVDVQRLVDLGGPQPAARVIHLASQVCAGLQEAHAQGLVHRDIKPANLMVVQREEDPDFVKILDFGLVKVLVDGPVVADAERPVTDEAIIGFDAESSGAQTTTTIEGAVMGTPAYMAPEQIQGAGEEGAEPDARTDVYALGSVMYFLLSGTPPFNLRFEFQLYWNKLNTDPSPPSERHPDGDVPADLERVIMRCLKREPGERYATMAELRDALARCGAAGNWTADDAQQAWQDLAEGRVTGSIDISPLGRTRPPGEGPDPTRVM